jgi:hypothetical protein
MNHKQHPATPEYVFQIDSTETGNATKLAKNKCRDKEMEVKYYGYDRTIYDG